MVGRKSLIVTEKYYLKVSFQVEIMILVAAGIFKSTQTTYIPWKVFSIFISELKWALLFLY